MRTTDRRARRHERTWNWGGLSLTDDDKLLMSAALTLTARYRRQPEDWPRLRWYARRLAIARRRQRIAEQPRVGDTITDIDGVRWTVNVVTRDNVWCRPRHQYFMTRERWREAVRRAQQTQEGSAQ